MKGQSGADSLQLIGLVLIVIGIIFSGEDQVLGYVCMGAGVVLQVVSLVVRRRRR